MNRDGIYQGNKTNSFHSTDMDETIHDFGKLIASEYHVMHNMQSEFITQGTFKAVRK